MNNKKGLFVVVEGLDGAGKTTAISRLRSMATLKDVPFLITREPGGTFFSEAIRNMFKSDVCKDTDPMALALLMAAARREHVLKVIRPALAAGKLVLCDRYSLTTISFQGALIAPEHQEVFGTVLKLGMDDLTPDYTLMLQISPETAIERLKAESQGNTARMDWLDSVGVDSMRLRALAYQAAIMDNYCTGKVLSVDAERDVDSVMFDVEQLALFTLFPGLAAN